MQVLGRQGLSNGQASNAGNVCNNMAQAQPQNMGGFPGMPGMPGSDPNNPNNQQAITQQNDPYGCQTNPMGQTCQQCLANPNLTMCKALAAGSAAPADTAQKVSAGFQAASRGNSNPGNFNIPDTSADLGNSGLAGAAAGLAGGLAAAAAGQGHTVPNNSGGGIPGGDGSSAPARIDPPRGGGGGYFGGASSVTDIDQGLRSGSGYSEPGGGGPTGGDATGGPDGKGGRKRVAGRTPASDRPVDLSQFLPGGKNDPSVAYRAAGMRPASRDIHGRYSDIWECISDRYKAKCRLSQLLGCDK